MVTLAAFAVAGTRLRAPAVRAVAARWRKDMAPKLRRRRWQPPSSIRRRTLRVSAEQALDAHGAIDRPAAREPRRADHIGEQLAADVRGRPLAGGPRPRGPRPRPPPLQGGPPPPPPRPPPGGGAPA